MAKPKPEKKRAPEGPALSTMRPLQLRIGDRLTDETGVRGYCATLHDRGRENSERLHQESRVRGTMIRVWGAHNHGETSRRARHEAHARLQGWRFGLTALVQEGRWTARIEEYEPERPSREQSPLPLAFATKSSSEEVILVLARKHAEDWIDR
jgi:hypothetical protein